MQKLHITLIWVGLAHFAGLYPNVLINPPQMISESDLQQQEHLLKKHTFAMSWLKPGRRFVASFEQGVASFLLAYETLPESFTEEARSQFVSKVVSSEAREVQIFEFSCGKHPAESDAGFLSYTSQEKKASQEDPYWIAPRREVTIKEREKVRARTLNECAELCSSATCMFYTGAGVSAAADIWTMGVLNERLGVEESEGEDDVAMGRLVQNPEHTQKVLQQFFTSLVLSPPTKAHIAIAEIAKTCGYALATENLDRLHQKTGIIPLRLDAAFLREHVSDDDLRALDVVLCIGLSCDDKGFLTWYKQCNPKGIICAIDLKQPCYLGEGDCFVQGDVQKLLPALEALIIDQES